MVITSSTNKFKFLLLNVKASVNLCRNFPWHLTAFIVEITGHTDQFVRNVGKRIIFVDQDRLIIFVFPFEETANKNLKLDIYS